MADARLEAAFGRPFPEQIAAFRLRLGNLVPTAKWDDIRRSAHDRAFMVAGATKADLLADLAGAVDKAISQGRGLKAFRKDFRRIVAERGWTGWTGEGSVRGEAWRTRVIYRTNMRVSYAAGRRAQLIEGDFALWIYRHGGSREPRPEHLALDGVTLAPDHPFWERWSPPNGWGCSCYVIGARSPAGAKRRGGDPDKGLPDGWDQPDPRTGAPKGIDKGWDYAPGATVSDDIRLLQGKLPELPAEIGAVFGAAARTQIVQGWQDWLAETRTRRDHVPGLAGVISPDVLDALKSPAVIATRGGQALIPQSAEIMVSPGIVAGRKARRHEVSGNALSEADWRSFPQQLEKPVAVLLDMESGRLLYIITSDAGTGQAAVALDYRIKGGDRARNRVNMVVSAYRPNRDEVKRRISAGRLLLLVGEVE